MAREPAGAEAFLRRLYAPYVASNFHFVPTGKLAPTIFDAHLTALIRKDQADAHGEVGALDGDPICDCQDRQRFTALSIKVTPLGPDRARANVTFTNFDAPETLTYTLTKTRAGWRVSDIGEADMPSLVKLLSGAK